MNVTLFITTAMLLLACGNTESTETASQHSNNDDQLVAWVDIEEAQQRAAQDNKYILVDVYTEWCGFCRRMNTETYRDERVLKAIEDYFHPVRLNAESKEKVRYNGEEFTKEELAMAFSVSSYPTTVIINPEGEPFAAQPGFLEARTFKDILNFVGTEAYEEMSFDDYQKQGN